MRAAALKTWLYRGTYPRLYLPILVIVVVVSLVRYHFLLGVEVEEAQERISVGVKHLEHYLIPRLAQAGGDSAQVQRLLDEEMAFNASIEALAWKAGPHALAAVTAQVPQPIPAWFAPLVPMERFEKSVPFVSAGGVPASLTITVNPQAESVQVWHTVATQLRISALNITIIFILLTLLLRANARMLSRLATATDAFSAGVLETRMGESGTLEARAVARTFNAMAAQVQGLVTTLQANQQQQQAQLHFTRQLIDALPLPVFVCGSGGECLSVNTAWEQLYGVTAAQAIGMRMDADGLGHALPPGGDAGAQEDTEVLVKNAAGELREMAYFSAAFTHTDGSPAGTICTLVDVTDRKRAQSALREEKERAEVTLSSIGEGVITTDTQGLIQTLNDAAHFLTGFSLAQAHGKPLAKVFTLEPAWSAYSDLIQTIASDGPVFARQQVLVHRSGERHSIEYTAAPIRKAGGAVMGTVLVFRDITENRELKKQITWQSRHDPLTGLGNRAALTERLGQAVMVARQESRPLAVCLLDLDHFHTINERFGARTGDRLLKAVAGRLQTLAQPSDMVARLGGDEFALLICGPSDADAIRERGEAVRAALAEPYILEGLKLQTSASVGITVFPLDDANPDTLLRHADQAMYQAKHAGRNNLHLFDPQQDHAVKTNFARHNRVALALRTGELVLHYQPKVNMRTGDILGMEALIRWQHPEQGLLAPQDFLPVIEHSDLSAELGEWVLQEALFQMQEWNTMGHRWVVSVNISAHHFHCSDFVLRLQSILQEFPLITPGQLELEILESAALSDMQHMREVMRQAQDLGVRFALDDFGTGYSSLSYLKTLPAETIKIDQSFVHGVLEGHENTALITAIVALAKVFDRAVVAEGVETVAQGQHLMALGCEHGQGFAIARPMPAGDVAAFAQGYTNVFDQPAA